MKFQSTLPVGGATGAFDRVNALQKISIHAPRGGSDAQSSRLSHFGTYFNPRSPWGERPQQQCHWEWSFRYFNPRSPWGERLQQFTDCRINCDISIHAPRGGSDVVALISFQIVPISIHAPRGGSDDLVSTRLRRHHRFQSTLPVGGATHSRAPSARTG